METVYYDDRKWTRLAVGLYRDERNHLHVMVPELLDYFGFADTPENRDTCGKEAARMLREMFPDIPLTELDR